MEKKRCSWCLKDKLYMDYHDDVWVESIGSVKNYFLSPGEPEFAPDAGSELICISIDGELAHVTDAAPDKCLFDYYPNFVFPCTNSTTNASKDLGDLNLGLKVFPNPFNEVLNLESSTPFQKIEVYDFSGKIVFQQNNLSNITNFELKNQFPSGIYLLKAMAVDGTFARAIVVKNRE